MTLLTAATTELLRELLGWDRDRITTLEGGGTSCMAYRARQDAAEVALGTPPEAWPQEIRELYQTLIEVRHFELVGQRPNVLRVMPRRALFRDAAIEIGADAPLREAVPELFDGDDVSAAAR